MESPGEKILNLTIPQVPPIHEKDDNNIIDSLESTPGALKRKTTDTSEETIVKKSRNESYEIPDFTPESSDKERSTSTDLTTSSPCQEPNDILEESEEDEEGVNTKSLSVQTRRPEATKFPKLYRLLRDNDDISRGISAKNPNGKESVARHVAMGSKRGSSSQFLSTCSSLESAETFRRLKLKHHYFKRGNMDIAEIDVGSLPDDVEIIDLRTKTLRQRYETGESDIDADFHKFAESHKEVLLIGKVPSSCLKLHKFTGTVPPDTDDSDSD